MANGGGRGWFHRRKPRPEPTPAPAAPEPSRIEAYETHGGDAPSSEFMPTAYAEPRGDRRAFDDLVNPSRNDGPSDPPSAPSTDDQPGSTGPIGPTAGPEPRLTSATAAPQPSSPVAHGPGRTPVEAPASPLPAAPRAAYDWDAATAAALNDEGSPSATAPTPLPSSAPDRLLEEIIREIVGDATAETVSSLQPSRDEPESREAAAESASAAPAPTTLVASPVAADDSAAHLGESPEAPAPTADASSADPAEDASTASPGLPSDAPTTEGDVAGERPAPPIDIEAPVTMARPAQPVEYPSQGEARDADESVDRPSATAGTAEVVPPSAPAHPAGDTLATDVSRETPHADGGTPLADQIADETRRRLALDEAVLPLPPSTRVLTISNQKGGVGKTTSAVNLAAALARAGARVLVIDLDPQGNASTALGVDHRSERQSVYEVLVSDLPLAEVIQTSSEHERLDCVPATIHLAGAEIELVSLVAREQRLRRALDAHLETMERPYDYVFIDCPPSLGLLTINAFVAAREVLIPIQCEYYALEGLSQLLSNIELIEKHLNPELRLSTILLTMYDSRTNLAQQVAQEVRDHFPTQTLDTIIPRSVRVSEAPSYGQSVISYDFASSGSLSYREAAAEIARRGASESKETN